MSLEFSCGICTLAVSTKGGRFLLSKKIETRNEIFIHNKSAKKADNKITSAKF